MCRFNQFVEFLIYKIYNLRFYGAWKLFFYVTLISKILFNKKFEIQIVNVMRETQLQVHFPASSEEYI